MKKCPRCGNDAVMLQYSLQSPFEMVVEIRCSGWPNCKMSRASEMAWCVSQESVLKLKDKVIKEWDVLCGEER